MRFSIKPLLIACCLFGLPAHAENKPEIQWLWATKQAGEQEKVFFRNVYTLPAGAKSADLTVSCDDWYRLFVNGEEVGMGSEWSAPGNYALLSKLKKGKNVIALEVRNNASAAGMALRLRTTLSNGKTVDWVSDASWKCAKEVSKGWKTAAKAPEGFSAPVVLAKMGDKPWGMVIEETVSVAEGYVDVTEDFQIVEGFKLEKLYDVPKSQGSWVAMTMDDQGRFYCANQGGKIYRVSVGEDSVAVEDTNIPVTGSQGLLWHEGVLWISTNENKQQGVWRVTDSDGNDTFDKEELIKPLEGRGEHGPHALVPSPDGEWIYFVAGNHVNMTEMNESMVPRVWDEDHLLPRRPDARGHARTRMAPGGWIARFRPDGTNWELVSIGYRNQYDVAFNEHGDLIAYDADMEWDLGMPWYRPTRICHVVPGSEFGWRNGTGKWPTYYEDSLPPITNIGPGSPTGVVSGKGAKFPAKYQKAIYCFDWTFATIYAMHLSPDGSTYKAEIEEFVAGKKFPLTDAVIGKDGHMYFMTGGRKTESALWRVSYTGSETIQAVEFNNKELALMDEKAALKALDSEDRFERFSGRVALEVKKPDAFRSILGDKGSTAWPVIEAVIGVARTGKPGDAKPLLSRITQLDWSQLGEQQKLAWLRAVALVYSRHGDQGEKARQQVLGVINPHYPSGSDTVNRELCRVLCYLQAPDVVPRTLTLMDQAGPTPTPDWLELAKRNDRYGRTVKAMMENLPPEQVIHYAYCLRVVKGPWKPDERKRYFTWIAKLMNNKGGNSYSGFLKGIRDDALANATAEEKKQVEAMKLVVAANPFANLPPVKGPGKAWSVDEIVALSKDLKGADLEKGKDMFRAGLCAGCHRFGGEGGAAGPDLTGLAGRFSPRDLAMALQEPNEIISDQFAFDLIVRQDGSTLTGKIVEEKDEKWLVATNPYDMSQTVEIERGDIKEVKTSPVSPMPAGLVNRMNEEELKALLAYLLGKQ
ncbi:MAG: c-type cytochrome [Akkermansiaceae bacterium]|nr:c-type cytochrome [Akkermansiaceae bacterium]